MVEVLVLLHLITPILGLILLGFRRETQRRDRLLRIAIQNLQLRKF